MSEDAIKIVAWLREAADELEKAHRLLDDLGVPEGSTPKIPYSLAARIMVLSARIPEEERHA